ncbi:MAG TPA: SDR family NAD(P)-dependent oxidoreductase [Steroidobacteraceae bacterium]|nr:SDR family NAD(P)-dependent oxidoreductase [Steroidobacteraceae bacterium]
MEQRQAGRVAVVSGAAGGLGQACAARLAQEGADIVVVDIKPCDETSALIERCGRRALVVNCDVTSPEQVGALARRVAESFGPCDILVNNAGIYSTAPFLEMSFETWRRYMALNLDAPFLMAQAFAPQMIARRWGRIINMASNSFHLVTVPGLTGYVASKGGLIGLTRALASELGTTGVTVNALAPGPTVTAQLEASFYLMSGTHDHGAFEAFTLELAQNQSIKRVATPADVVGALAFLASGDAGFMTGQTLVVDGGWARL